MKRPYGNMTVPVSLLAAVCMVLFASSCQKSPMNGKLDGMWQVMEVTPEPDDKPFQVNIYYNFYNRSIQLSAYGQNIWTSGNMVYEGETMLLEFPYAKTELSKQRLRQFGINENPVTFEVVELTSSRLVLQSAETTVRLRKF